MAGEIEYKFVLNTFISDTTTLIDIYIDNEHITTTEEHPFWVPTLGWVAAKDLKAGMYLQTSTETWLDIDKVDRQIEATKVYNFEVEGFHTYFVSDLGLLVHNTCDFEGVQPGDLFIKEFPTLKEPLTFRSEVQIDGKILHLKDIGIFPAESRRVTASQIELRNIFKELRQQAKAGGFEQLRITGRRSSGASFDPTNINSGRRIDITWDLTP